MCRSNGFDQLARYLSTGVLQNVADGDDPDHPAIVVDDGQASDLLALHELDGGA
jgi:hypothetical protein